jgi:hypothetical protein
LKIPDIKSIKFINKKIIIYAILFLFLSLLPLSAFVSMKPGFCGGCHALRREADSLKQSTHKNINCISCHQKPGAAGFIEYLLGGAGNFSKWLLRADGTIKADVDDKSCDRCHSQISEIVLTKKGIAVSHQHFTNVGYRCTDCHNTVAHDEAVTNPSFAGIDKCVVCHDGKKVKKYPRLFDADKSGKTSWSVVHGTNKLKTHGAGNLNTCQGCHSRHFCRKCHQVDLPHTPSFTYEHGKLSMEKGATCFTCHKSGLCVSCHRVKMPHPVKWLAKHSSATPKIGEKVCQKCHSKYDCTDCHESHIHPGQGKTGNIAVP